MPSVSAFSPFRFREGGRGGQVSRQRTGHLNCHTHTDIRSRTVDMEQKKVMSGKLVNSKLTLEGRVLKGYDFSFALEKLSAK